MAPHISDTLSDKENRRCGYFFCVARGIPADSELAIWASMLGSIWTYKLDHEYKRGSGLLVNILNDQTYKWMKY